MSLHGLLLIDKPTGITSHDVVGQARRALKMRDIGHAGTLDPLASGLMVLLLGEGTKLSDYILHGDKAYHVRVKLGVRTDSLDMTGQVLETKPVDLASETITKAALALQGEFNWPIPLFSAAKVDGKKLYEYAHKQQEAPVIPSKVMKFWGVQVLAVGADYVEAAVACSKGSFVRTWASQLGERLGVGGAVETLKRVTSAPYELVAAVDLESLKNEKKTWEHAFIPIQETLAGWKTLTVTGKDEKLIYNGQISYDLDRRLIGERRESTRLQQAVGVKIVNPAGVLLAILEAQPGKGLKIRRVFRTNEI